jgi:predicted aconitase with swiveling domain
MLFQAFGFSLTGQLTLNGTFNTSGYLFTLTGTVSGMAVNLSFTGGLDSGTGRQTFTGTGSAGGFSVSESGEYDFDNSNPLDIFYTGGEVATLAGKGGFDIEIEGKQEVTVTDAGDHYIIRDVSTYIDTPSGNKHIEISNITPSKPQGQGAYNVTTDQINLIGNVDFNAGTISGQLSPIPEPGTVLLLGPALAALFFRRRAKRCNQSTSR